MQTTNKLPAEERREVTIEAVIELAALQNPSEITTAAIAKHMNVTQGALFRHFATKDEIWQAVMAWVSHYFLAQIDRTILTIEEPVVALQAMFMSHVEFVTRFPGVPRILFGELQRAQSTPAKAVAQSMIQQYSKRICALIEQGKAIGVVAPEVDTKDAAILFIGTVQGLIMQSILSGDILRIQNDAPGVYAIYQRGIKNWKI